MMLENIGKKGQKMRKVYQRRLPENPNLDYYYIIRETNPLESLLVEYGFIDNKNDATKLRNNLNDYVEGVVEAIANYINVPYSKPGESSQMPQGDYYTVVPGDTLYKIANLYNLSVDELKRINNLDTNTISVGQKLLVNPNNVNNDPNYITYTVVPGDSLSKLARQFNTTVDEIKSINNLTSNTIVIGEELLIPNNTVEEDPIDIVNPSLYVVKRGDSLWKIARDFNTTVDEIISLNNLDSINLQIGQTLQIPGGNQDNIYTVQSGDTIFMGNNE
ncbi:MAG: LysM peptidoglycan-binding domain-containing protein [Bacilli bacterium]|nr:LysM peptidoglycan-binding domain-containing protein [Bacilli bacterium]